jgi:hypothetical protein
VNENPGVVRMLASAVLIERLSWHPQNDFFSSKNNFVEIDWVFRFLDLEKVKKPFAFFN